MFDFVSVLSSCIFQEIYPLQLQICWNREICSKYSLTMSVGSVVSAIGDMFFFFFSLFYILARGITFFFYFQRTNICLFSFFSIFFNVVDV